MRKISLFAILAVLFTTSCNKNNDASKLDLPAGYCYATVMAVGVDPTSDDDSDSDVDDNVDAEIYFMLDSKETFIVTENVSKTDLNDLKAGERVITGVTLEKNTDDSYKFTAKLYEVIDVELGESATVTNEAESLAIADDEFSYIAKDMILTRGYLNMLVGVQSENVDDVKFYLVDNKFDTPDDEDDDYLYLELRYDSAGEEGEGSNYEGYVSFDMESYRDELEGLDGILLRIKTKKSGTTTVKVDSIDLFED